MKTFDFFQPTEIVYGLGRVKEIGEIAKKYGNSCLLVTVKEFEALAPMFKRVLTYLEDAGLNVVHFDGVVPNPTTEVVSAGAKMAQENNIDVVIGLGGGSSMDVAKAIAVESSHEGTAWDYLYYKTPPTENTLPIIAVSTTSGTGSQMTQCSVITKTEDKDKSAIWHPNIYPKVAVVDPELMVTMPSKMTAVTGFDVFAHSFEGYISTGSSPYTEILSVKAIKLVVANLKKAVEDGTDIEAREAMAFADILAGTIITNAGVTLPHGLGMQISGHCPHVAHGVSLALTYPEFTRYTYESAIEKFAVVGRIFNRELYKVSDEEAAKACCEEIDKFIKDIGLWLGFRDLNVTKEDIREIADCGQVLSDYQNNPKVATIDEMHEILMSSYER